MARDWIAPGIAMLRRICGPAAAGSGVDQWARTGGGLELALVADLRIAH
jgi:hypothetical protein